MALDAKIDVSRVEVVVNLLVVPHLVRVPFNILYHLMSTSICTFLSQPPNPKPLKPVRGGVADTVREQLWLGRVPWMTGSRKKENSPIS
jgi:hypothetical protein